MEFTRAIFVGALLLVAFMLWNAWQNDYPNKPITTQANQLVNSLPPIASAQDAIHAGTSEAIKNTAKAASQKTAASTSQIVHVRTDVLDVAIDTLGGNIIKADLLAFPKQLNDPKSPPFELLNTTEDTFYVAQSGLFGKGGPDSEQGQAIYTVNQMNYSLSPDQKQLEVELNWRGNNNITVRKIFTFVRGDYAIKVNYQIKNQSKEPWVGKFYAQLQRKKVTEKRSLFNIASFTGGAISTPDKPYEKIAFDKMGDSNQPFTQALWVAMLQHYFLSAWIPPQGEKFNSYSMANGNDTYTLGLLGPNLTIAPGTQQTTGARVYVGPENMDRLKALAPNLDLTIDYGMLWFISIAIFWLMKHIYNYVGNWGWSIVIVTILIKLLFYHLSAKSYRSMAGMRRLQPRLQKIRELYGDDRQKMTQATMQLYREEKVSPVGGCLPMIIQIPVFIALYWVLIESVELRQAPFIFWIHDLSTKDPFYVLPILMGLTMFLQQKLNPPPPDPTQAKVMMFMPIMFTALFMNFPSGLVLYWLVNNAVSILQQWWIMRRYDSASTAVSIKTQSKNKLKK